MIINEQVGDIVYVIREESNGMCMGVVGGHNKYCKLPVQILQAISQVYIMGTILIAIQNNYHIQDTDNTQSDSDDDSVYEHVENNSYADKGGFLNLKVYCWWISNLHVSIFFTLFRGS